MGQHQTGVSNGMSLPVIDRRLRDLERAQQREKKTAVGTQDYWFRCVPTCPPSTAVTIRAGIVYPNPDFWFWLACQCQVPETVADFANPNEPTGNAGGTVMELTWNFTGAYWYKSCVMRYHYQYVESREPRSNDLWPNVFTFRGGTTEYETAAEAEAAVDLLLNGTSQTLDYSAIPLWAFVLKNNGVTGFDGQVMEIDPINRGRSYIYRDCRVRNYLW